MPKAGCSLTECEDAIGLNSRGRRFAVADGATEAFDSKTWAKLVTRSWVRVDPPALSVEDFVPLVRDLGARLQSRWKKKSLPWYAEEKARQGSFTAFVGVQFYLAETPKSWKAIAVGDSCLVQKRGQEIVKAFPISDVTLFGSNPILVPSLAPLQDRMAENFATSDGAFEVNDEFLLLTDAVAAWYLDSEKPESSKSLAMSLLASSRYPELENHFQDLRARGEMRNDDVTIVRILVREHA